ncbi:hypothetical protein ACE193_13495 [Bernardetia sp. OM2101]|uniref:hypothetical protein n=1 Tax=Bernardetia sp. OM2101 TaxID=3344876 RepID=UPI0035CF9E2A
MKPRIYLFLLILLSSCGDYEYVRFETAQPSGEKAQKSFARKMKGEYLSCLDKNDKLVIDDKLILNYITFEFISHRNDLEFDSTTVIDRANNEDLQKLFEGQNWNIEFIGDTIKGSFVNIDTVFQISDEQVLKKFKGSYFLNIKEDENFWRVNRLDLTKDSLFIGYITPSDTLLNYDFVIKNEKLDASDSSKTIEYVISPSRKEFKELMKPNSFEEIGCYCKKK